MTLLPLPDLSKIERVLIIRLSSIGDVVHALPVSAALKNAYPHLEISWVVEEMSAEIVIGNPYLHEVIVIPRSRWKAGRGGSVMVWREYIQFLLNLRRRKFDLSIDLQGRAKSGLLAAATGAPYRFGWKRLREGSQLISHSAGSERPGRHRVEWFLNVVKALGVEPSQVEFPLDIPQSSIDEVYSLLAAHGMTEDVKFAVVNPAVGDQMRRWGAENFAQLILRLGVEFGLSTVLIGSSKDCKLCERILNRVQFLQQSSYAARDVPTSCISLAGKTDLKSLAALIDRSEFQVCGDTGSAHIGAAMNKPTIALYGPTDPEHAGPWAQNDLVISRWQMCRESCDLKNCAYRRGARVIAASETENDSQNGTAEIGSNAPTALCMADISVDELMERVNNVMKGQHA